MAETKTSPTLNSYFKLTVQVLDSNDNAPEFQSDPYDIMVSEALAPGTDVVQVQALDPDFGANGEIRYISTYLRNIITYLYCFALIPQWLLELFNYRLPGQNGICF